jgi:hypothetical protein
VLNHATQITGLARAELTANTERNLWRLLESKVGASGTAPGACRPRPGSLFVPLRLPALFVRSGIIRTLTGIVRTLTHTGIIRTHVGGLGSADPMAMDSVFAYRCSTKSSTFRRGRAGSNSFVPPSACRSSNAGAGGSTPEYLCEYSQYPAERLPQLERRRANPAVAHLHAPGLGLTPLFAPAPGLQPQCDGQQRQQAARRRIVPADQPAA